MAAQSLALCVVATLLAPTTGWSLLSAGSRFDMDLAETKFDRRGNKIPFTCGGVPMSEQIKKNVRGENPDVPVSFIARFPMLDPVAKFLSDFHVVCAVIFVVIAMINLVGPKGNDASKGKAAFHIWLGRLASWGIVPHYVAIGCWLNVLAIYMPLEDWKLAPPLSEWRMQTAYIWPFAANILVSNCMGFFLCRYSFMPQAAATPLKWLTAASIAFWWTIGLYMMGSQAFELGLGGFGADVVSPGGDKGNIAQPFWQPMTFVIVAVGTVQSLQDLVAYKALVIVEESGTTVLSWKDMHKWAMVDLMWQAAVIFGFFASYFPFCLYGFPEWTCISSPFFAVPLILVLSLPIVPHAKWTYGFIGALFSGKMAEFSKLGHAWDGIKDGSYGTKPKAK